MAGGVDVCDGVGREGRRSERASHERVPRREGAKHDSLKLYFKYSFIISMPQPRRQLFVDVVTPPGDAGMYLLFMLPVAHADEPTDLSGVNVNYSYNISLAATDGGWNLRTDQILQPSIEDSPLINQLRLPNLISIILMICLI